MREDNVQEIMEEKREELYSDICEMCEAYYNVVREILPDQGDAEGHFLPLWRRLGALFQDQRWDYGEFRPVNWNEALELIKRRVKKDLDKG